MSNEYKIPEVGKFEKVSFDEFFKACKKRCDDLTEEKIRIIYDDIKLPERKTAGAAGYDFYLPQAECFKPGVINKIPTGIKCKIEPGWWLSLMVRSSLGTKHNLRFANTIPVIDSDYYGCEENEGHIFLPVVMDATCPDGIVTKEFIAAPGERLCQGIFLPYGITVGDTTSASRTGGFGSTNSSSNRVLEVEPWRVNG